ncbi:50S ribosomal protein L1 [Candidatus Methylacidithermus pantelleriae]|uniref:Large ribosomal subunit protein uL1 n=1 Tax=Candidatus Methylacidithermus pantelleriae TaxID=2744239 RepID=A0A8J2BND5_9BACT|nr:50S ribosomal protein L1 [Candidatus Methylacidithermus pantelleriae]CAF0693066.1 50S ribosomal subunit protein L1 [Candidatus Methylacidithermus pantelleriae]
MAVAHSKRYQEASRLVEPGKVYDLAEAIRILKAMPPARFDQSVELAMKLGVDPKQSDQMVRGAVTLPHGTGKKVRILVFAKGEAAERARKAGADYVGLEDLVRKITEGFLDFDVAIATPEAMTEVRKLGKILGPRGLMPNPKTGTVTDNVERAIAECRAGRVEFKLDKNGNIHLLVGKISFAESALQENVRAAVEAVVRARPASAKGRYIESAALSLTFSPSVRIDAASLVKH